MYKSVLVILLVLALVGLSSAQLAHATTTTTTEIELGNIGYAEGYSHMPMSHPNDKKYVDNYNMGVRDFNALSKDPALIYLGKVLPSYKNDNYARFLAGQHQGDAAYNAQQGHNDFNSKCPGHTEEFCTGYNFGFGLDENFDAS
jgi:hypothetical protein